MTTIGTTASTETNDQHIPRERNDTNGTDNVTVDSIANNGNDQANGTRCFVCDVKVQGRHYSLATCRTQSSRARVIEKLGELVGERYMVVISEDDVICRNCANLMNTLDRLESEMRGVRDTILRFLEQKYSLEEGELLGNSDITRPSQPPQITKRSNYGSGYHTRKRPAVAASEDSNSGKHKMSNVWMQCDKCRYTTRYNAFMVHHIRQHKVYCDKCGLQFPGKQQTAHHCVEKDEKQSGNEMMEQKETEKVSHTEDANMQQLNIAIEDTLEGVPIISVSSNSQVQIPMKEEGMQLIRLTNPDLQLQNIIAAGQIEKPAQSMYVRVLQPIDIDQGNVQSTSIAGADPTTEIVMKVKDVSGKQMLTLAEDGSLEMVEVSCWDDVHPPDPDPNIPF